MKQRDRYTTTAAINESAKNPMFVCEVPLRSGLTRLIDLQTSKPTAWRVASDHVSIQTYTRLASSQLNPVFRALADHGRARLTSIWITPALTERRKRFEFVSGVDGKIGDSRPSAERADPDARCRFGSTLCYPDSRVASCVIRNVRPTNDIVGSIDIPNPHQ